MLKEIGSNFWLSDNDTKNSTERLLSPEIFNCIGNDYVWLSTCRSAISMVIKTIENRNPGISKRVCLPAFTCHTVYEPFINAGYEIYPFHVDNNLKSDVQEILDYVLGSKVGIVLFHRYFGFDTLDNIDDIIPTLRKNNVIVIEDCTQSMYSSISRMDADYFVGSIRKWCGVPDGGFAVCKDDIIINKPLFHDSALEKAKYEASMLKYDYIANEKGKKEDYLQKYAEAEEILDNQECFYSIAPLSIKVQNNQDLNMIKNKRRTNYKTLLNSLKKNCNITPIFNEIPDSVVPLYFPILCDDRKEIQTTLINNSIYAPIIWPKGENCPPVVLDVDYIYEHILCIPIDQRYSTDDMERVSDVLNGLN